MFSVFGLMKRKSRRTRFCSTGSRLSWTNSHWGSTNYFGKGFTVACVSTGSMWPDTIRGLCSAQLRPEANRETSPAQPKPEANGSTSSTKPKPEADGWPHKPQPSQRTNRRLCKLQSRPPVSNLLRPLILARSSFFPPPCPTEDTVGP